jgi:hypothetical protein
MVECGKTNIGTPDAYVVVRHGNPDSVSGTLSEAWANEPPGMVPGGSFFLCTGFPRLSQASQFR